MKIIDDEHVLREGFHHFEEADMSGYDVILASNISHVHLDTAKEFATLMDNSNIIFAAFPLRAAHAATEPNIPDDYKDYLDVFREDIPDAEHAPHDHAIDLKPGKEPPYRPIYNLSPQELSVLREYIEKALEKNWIRPSKSPAGAPVLFAPKKDGTLRLCVDYRGLNEITVKNRYPLPLISEILDRIRIRAGDEWKTAFRTRYGHFEYLVLPFGLTNAPATFQSYINKALSDILDVYCVAYLDDIVIYSNTLDEHVAHVKNVLEQIGFLGFVITTQGITVEKRRVDTILDWPEPRTINELQTFLGFANFYRRFIYKFSIITAPLTELLKGYETKKGKNNAPVQLNENCKHAILQLKECFTEAPLLVHFDPQRKLRIETDGSGVAIAAVISQLMDDGHWHPIAFWSRKLTEAERRYQTYDLEMLPIVEAFRQWRHYLHGSRHPIVVLSDHANLRRFMTTKQLNGRQIRWMQMLSAFDFEIEHHPGENNPADAPSRHSDYIKHAAPLTGLPTLQEKLHENEVAGVTGLDLGTLVPRILAVKVFESEIAYREEVAESIVELLLQVQNRDAGTSELRRRLEVGDASVGDRSTWAVDKDGLLRKDGKVYVPQDKAVRHEIMKMNHDDPQGGHFGRDKTIEAIKRKYSWHGMSDEIAEYVRTCDVCQRVKIPRHKPYGLLQPHPVPDKKWHTISMDFIEGLPDNKKGSQTYNAIVVFVDSFTKWAIIVPTSSKLDAEGLADIIVWKLAKNFGLPANIISDRDSLINSKFWSTLCYLLHVRRKLSTAFHPQTDGQTERLNQVIEHYLRTYCSYQQDNWIEWIPLAQWAYNNAFHASIKMTPSEAMIGRPTELRIDVEPPSTGASKSAIEQVERMKQAENRIRECLEAAKAAEKK
ncbi:hypothetical protein HCAG_02942 [Histoplasma mississippiense (nom. inval.)]|uniref:hypothetical protein n=1 Tax=Ajellomyces capsulatus (strain NAm1 / WU24) TaxID=2059318 RepID=UPI000157BC88|nr:hypothetical protein HCAG_02942 [Histoplasma mississippiense (nom. inval.)]EDN06339.1 hypothetical protein HCAG_02942 [Histoplasma mississippiense (nom. inval.)]